MFEDTNFRNLVAVRESQNKEMFSLAASERLYRASLPARGSRLASLGRLAAAVMSQLQERFGVKALASR